MLRKLLLVILIALILPSVAAGKTYKVKSYAYNGHRKQTDRTPGITAFNKKPRQGITLAVSRDLKHLKNKQVRLVDKKTKKVIGIYTVHDLMAEKHRRSVDIYFGKSRKAKIAARKFGVQNVRLEVIPK